MFLAASEQKKAVTQGKHTARGATAVSVEILTSPFLTQHAINTSCPGPLIHQMLGRMLSDLTGK